MLVCGVALTGGRCGAVLGVGRLGLELLEERVGCRGFGAGGRWGCSGGDEVPA